MMNREATERLNKLEAEYTHLYFAEKNTEAEQKRMREIDEEVKVKSMKQRRMLMVKVG